MNETVVKDLGVNQDYTEVFNKMLEFTKTRTNDTPDQIWVLEHSKVYTLGQAGKKEHILNSKTIPVVQSDRGGQVTYHGPGQIVIYFLLNLEKLNLNIKEFVCALEQSIINLLKKFDIIAHRIPNAPGVYVNEKKICSIGLRVKKGYTYHGLAFNADMDLSPFLGINPCGYANLEVTQFKNYNTTIHTEELKKFLINELLIILNLK